jgi:hypothetical protein
MLRAMSRQGVMRQAERESLLKVMRDCPDELSPLVESIILRETDRLGQGQAVRKLLASGSNEAVLLFLKALFPNYRRILVDVVNEAIRKIVANRRPGENETKSDKGEKA